MKTLARLLPRIAILPAISAFAASSTPPAPFRLVVLDPGHFHAALLQKTMYAQVDPTVYVYAPAGEDVNEHVKRINAYNSRADKPTSWKTATRIGPDYFERMLREKTGNVVVMSGNNRRKPERIIPIVEAGMHVFADKPMVIEPAGFEPLKRAFAAARQRGVILYDIMTERSEITNVLQREFAQMPEVFGKLETGTPDNPAVSMESVHFVSKLVSGAPLRRAAWFFDVNQIGEGMVDVGTHLVDLVQWECFPGKTIDYTRDIQIGSARHWPTTLTTAQFTAVTGLKTYPDALKSHVKDSVLGVNLNGEINYRINGIYARVVAKWDFEAPEGSGDTHYSILRGSKCNLVIRQGKEQHYKPTLYIEPAGLTDPSSFLKALPSALADIQRRFPGVDLKQLDASWEVTIPAKYDDGHEAHFAEVTERFLKYITARQLPEWEEPNMIAKYYTTTKGLELARQGEPAAPAAATPVAPPAAAPVAPKPRPAK